MISSNPPQAAAVLSLPARPQPPPGLLSPGPLILGASPPAPHLGSRHHLLMKVAGPQGRRSVPPPGDPLPMGPIQTLHGWGREQLGSAAHCG